MHKAERKDTPKWADGMWSKFVIVVLSLEVVLAGGSSSRKQERRAGIQTSRQLYDSAATDDSNPAHRTPVEVPPQVQGAIEQNGGEPIPLASESGGKEAGEGARVSDRIIRGSAAAANEFGWYASPYHEDCEFDWFESKWQCQPGRYLWSGCGGSLVGPRHVLTAAHCINYKLVNMPGVRMYEIGAYCKVLDFADNCNQYSELVQIDSIHLHPSFAQGVGNVPVFDFAIVTLKRAATVAPVLWDRGHLPPPQEGATVSVAGFGANIDYGGGTFGGTPDVLQFVDLHFVPDAECARIYREADTDFQITDEMMCALHPDKDACSGDSGGPLLARDAQGNHVLLGVVSWGVGCAHGSLPGVYAQLSKVVPWVESFLHSQAPPPSNAPTFADRVRDSPEVDAPQIGADEAPNNPLPDNNGIVDHSFDNGGTSAADAGGDGNSGSETDSCEDFDHVWFRDDSGNHRKCKWLRKGSAKKQRRRRAKYCNGERGKQVHVICAKSCGCPDTPTNSTIMPTGQEDSDQSSPFASVNDFH